jgi:2-methylisocitrate lyase-like PEP mutase family enzyme
MTKTAQIRALLEPRQGLVVPGCHDALSARQVAAARFPATYLSGFAANAVTGLPDLGVMALDRMVGLTHDITRAIDLPLFVDADNGHGGPAQVGACIRRLEAAGAVGANIDDQVLPRPAGAGKTLIPIPAMQDKIAAARAACTDPDFLVIGRTDAMATHGLAEALRRAKALEEAGADAIMVMYLTEAEQVRTLAAALTPPLFIAITETARKSFAAADLAGAGHAATIYPVTSLLSAFTAQARALAHLAEYGDTQSLERDMEPIAQIRALGEGGG